MGVTINKVEADKTIQEKPKLKKVKDTLLNGMPVAQVVDELGELKKRLVKAAQRMKPMEKSYSILETSVIEWVDSIKSADQGHICMGEHYAMDVTEKGNSSKVTNPEAVFKLLNKVEKGLAVKLMTFGIGDLRKYLTPTQFESMVKTERTSKRQLKFQEK